MNECKPHKVRKVYKFNVKSYFKINFIFAKNKTGVKVLRSSTFDFPTLNFILVENVFE